MGAIFSFCGTWRYWLDRQIDMLGGPTYLFIGVNPSKAGAIKNDPTVGKWVGFTTRAGGSGFIAVNPFAYCSTDVKELANAADPIGPDNDRMIMTAIAQADVLVPCWGSLDKLPKGLRPRVAAVRDMLLASGKPIKVFGETASGDPKHPLMLGYAGGLMDWNICRPPLEWELHADGFTFGRVAIFPGLFGSWEVWHKADAAGDWSEVKPYVAAAREYRDHWRDADPPYAFPVLEKDAVIAIAKLKALTWLYGSAPAANLRGVRA